MAKRGSSRETEIDLQFPLEGLDETRSYTRQRSGTTAEAQNVRAFDPKTNRARGSQRSGMQKFFTGQTVWGDVQDINHLVASTSPPPAATTFGGFVYAQLTEKFGIGLGTDGSVVLAGLGTAGYTFANSCWDDSGNLYIAERVEASGEVNFKKIASDGSTTWTQSAFGTAAGSTRNVPGMVVIGSYLFIALTVTNAPYPTNGLGNHCAIHRLNTSDGGISIANWQIAGFYKNVAANFPMYFSTASHNCLGKCGTTLGVECVASGTAHRFMTFNSILPGGQAFLKLVSYYTQTAALGGAIAASQAATRVVSDGIANFYVISSCATKQLKKIGTNGVIAWASTACDPCSGLAFDVAAQKLVAIAASGPSVRSIALATGAIASSAITSSIFWNEIDSDGQGNFTLWKNNTASNDIMGISQTLGTVWGPSTRANAVHSGASANKGTPTQPPVQAAGPRKTRLLIVANGECRRANVAGDTGIMGIPAVITGGDSFNASSPLVFSAANGLDMFYADGIAYHYYKGGPGTNADTVQLWTATAGTLPTDDGHCARLICTWRGRTVLAGFPINTQLWFMSKQFDSFNWDFSPATTTQAQAVSGNVALAGFTGDMITCIIPYTDDLMIFGCDHTIWQLTGDPMAGGRFDNISDSLGMAWGRPYARDPFGQIYFFSSKSGIYKMTPGAMPVRVSQQIDKRIQDIDLSLFIVRMAWDLRLQGLGVWITPIDPDEETVNYFFEERTNAWWPDVYGKVAHNPMAVHVYDGDQPGDRAILLGGRDGYVRAISHEANTDDGTAIVSNVLLGPLSNREWDELVLKDLQATLGQDSGPVTFKIFVGNTAEQALSNEAVVTGTWNAGRNLASYVRRSGISIFVELSATAPWTLERLAARYSTLGRIRRRYM